MTARFQDNRIDEDLMAGAAGGSREDFSELVHRWHGKVLGWIGSRLGDRETARDLTQDCFLKLFRSAPSYQVQSRFSTYLFTIARRLVIDETRRRTMKFVPLVGEKPAPGPRPDAVFDEKDRRNRLRSAIDGLPDQERQVLQLSEFGGLRYREIAELVGCPEGTVASRKNRAMRMLREALKGLER